MISFFIHGAAALQSPPLNHQVMPKNTRTPRQPAMSDERMLVDAVENRKEYVKVRNSKIGFSDLCGWARHKISKVIVSEGGDEFSVGCKCVAAARLNGYFSIMFLWWFLWRWYYFIRRYTDSELAEAVALVKKKVAPQSYFTNTILLIGIRETMMHMNRQEVAVSLQELSGDKAGKSARSDNG